MNQLGLLPGGVASSAATAAPTSAKGSSQLGQSDFLKLMSTQLSNQDPTNPMDNSQFLAQIAQFSSVSGIQDMQNTLKQLSDALISNQTMQAASLGGHQVVSTGSNAVLGSDRVLSGAINISQSTNDLKVGIYDSAGQLVRKVDMGPQGKGMLPITWDGVTDTGDQAPNGIYQIKAQADVNGSPQAMDTYVASVVSSVVIDPASKQIMLNTSNGESVKMSDVKQIM